MIMRKKIITRKKIIIDRMTLIESLKVTIMKNTMIQILIKI
jgi:hypothetical protein